MHHPSTTHWSVVKRVLRYLKCTIHLGPFLHKHSPLTLYAFVDADWAENSDDRTSTLAYVVFRRCNPISWSSKKQKTVARSSIKVEYRAVATTTTEINWVHNLLYELHGQSPYTPTIYYDNVGTTYVYANPIFHSRMKHIAIDFHFVCDQVSKKLLRVSHIHTFDQLADSLTKPLPCLQFLNHRSKSGIHDGSSILWEHERKTH